jgi:hypothetical protein
MVEFGRPPAMALRDDGPELIPEFAESSGSRHALVAMRFNSRWLRCGSGGGRCGGNVGYQMVVGMARTSRSWISRAPSQVPSGGLASARAAGAARATGAGR